MSDLESNLDQDIERYVQLAKESRRAGTQEYFSNLKSEIENAKVLDARKSETKENEGMGIEGEEKENKSKIRTAVAPIVECLEVLGDRAHEHEKIERINKVAEQLEYEEDQFLPQVYEFYNNGGEIILRSSIFKFNAAREFKVKANLGSKKTENTEKKRQGNLGKQKNQALEIKKTWQSYSRLLKPSYSLSEYRKDVRMGQGKKNKDKRAIVKEMQSYNENIYSADIIDDPRLWSGLNKTVLGLTGMMSSVVQYSRAEELYSELNDRFKEKHPRLASYKLSIDRIRRTKKSMVRIALGMNIELSTVAMAMVYYEKLLLCNKARINALLKHANKRNILAAVCLVLATKVNEANPKNILPLLISNCARTFEINKKLILEHEFLVYSKLEFSLFLAQADFMPHLSRIFASLHQYDSPMDYLGPNMFYSIGSTPFVLKAHPRSDILSSYSASTVVDPYYNWAKTSISFDPF